MEDVVVHYKPGLDQDLPALIETTEKLLAPFPQRPPQVFCPWFPSIVDRHLPLRPARSPPRILSAPDTGQAAGPTEDPEQDPEQGCGSRSRVWAGPTQRQKKSENDGNASLGVNKHEPNSTKAFSPDRGVPFVPETPPDPTAQHPGLQAQEPGPQIQEPGLQARESKPESPSKRCWTVFTRHVPTKVSRVQTMSRRFQQTVSKLRLQSRQRVKWIIDKNNCRDIEQVWRCLSRPPLGLALPSCCNAHIERSLAQVWVYCDLLQSEQVGLSLKQGLKLRGRILLWERRLGSFYSL